MVRKNVAHRRLLWSITEQKPGNKNLLILYGMVCSLQVFTFPTETHLEWKLKLGVPPFLAPFPLKCWLPAFKFRVPSRCCYAIALLMKCEYLTGPAILCHGLPSKRYQFNTSKQHVIYAKAKIHLRKLKQFKEGCVVGNVHIYHAWTLNDTVLSSFFLFFFSSSHSLCLSWSFFYPRVSRCRDLVF